MEIRKFCLLVILAETSIDRSAIMVISVRSANMLIFQVHERSYRIVTRILTAQFAITQVHANVNTMLALIFVWSDVMWCDVTSASYFRSRVLVLRAGTIEYRRHSHSVTFANAVLVNVRSTHTFTYNSLSTVLRTRMRMTTTATTTSALTLTAIRSTNGQHRTRTLRLSCVRVASLRIAKTDYTNWLGTE